MRNLKTMQAAARALWGPHYRSELARALGVHLRTAMRWDRAERPVPDKVFEQLAKLLAERKVEIDKVLARMEP
jgi:hypothetical protein